MRYALCQGAVSIREIRAKLFFPGLPMSNEPSAMSFELMTAISKSYL
jgi:hypothetical protein